MLQVKIRMLLKFLAVHPALLFLNPYKKLSESILEYGDADVAPDPFSRLRKKAELWETLRKQQAIWGYGKHCASPPASHCSFSVTWKRGLGHFCFVFACLLVLREAQSPFQPSSPRIYYSLSTQLSSQNTVKAGQEEVSPKALRRQKKPIHSKVRMCWGHEEMCKDL